MFLARISKQLPKYFAGKYFGSIVFECSRNHSSKHFGDLNLAYVTNKNQNDNQAKLYHIFCQS